MFNKHFAAIILVLAMLFAGFNLADGTASSYASENTESNVEKVTVVDSGTCGTKLKWELDSEGTLTISGTGAMTNYGHNTTEDTIYIPNPNDKTDMSVIAPFYDRDDIKKVVLEQGVTSTGNYAFYKCDGITEVIFPETGFTRLGAGSFRKCTFLEEITIPDTVTYYGGHAFMDDASLKKVNIPDGIETISNNTFTGCESLTEIEIPDSVTSIAAQAFWKCYNLEKVNIPDGVTEIPKDCFNKCYALKEIGIPDGVTSIGTYAFRDCTSLTEVKLPEGITAIKAYTFYGCTNLEKVNIPDGVTELGNAAFRDCTSLKEIELPDSVTTVGTFLFKSCSSLEKANVPAGLTSVGYAMFSSCKSLKEISVPDTITKIEDSGFYECESLETLDLPKGITEIEQYAFAKSGVKELDLHNISDIPYRAFYQCKNLETLTLADELTSFGEQAFRECESLKGEVNIPEGVTKIASREFYKCYELEKITIPESVTEIGDHAFAYCESIEEIHIPDSVTAITDYLFYRCKSLKEVTMPKAVIQPEESEDESAGDSTESGTDDNITDEENPSDDTTVGEDVPGDGSGDIIIDEESDEDNDEYHSVDEAFGKCVFYECSSLENITLPEGLKVIPYATFCRAYSLKEVKIPDTVTVLGGYCFEGCNSLKSINIPDSVATIERGAFYSAKGLTEITIPEGVTKIPMNFCTHASSLKKVNIPSSVNTIGKNAFRTCEVLEKIIITEGVISVEKEAFRECRNATVISLPSTLKKIGKGAFFNCHSAETIDLPEGLIILDDYALYCCNAINEIVVPENITEIKQFVFYGCQELKKITFLGNITTIENNAFTDCFALEKIDIQNTVTSIGERAFENCTSITEVILPTNVTNISRYTFRGCSNLASITISEGTNTIDDYAFENCSQLKQISIPRNVSNFGLSAIPSATRILCYKDSPAEKYAKEKNRLYAYIDVPEEDNVFKGTINTAETQADWSINRITGKMVMTWNGVFPGYTSSQQPWKDARDYIESIEIKGSPQNISKYAFYKCNNIKDITIYSRDCGLTGLLLNDDVTIYGFKSSTAEKYASDKKYNFVAIDNTHTHTFEEATNIKHPTCEDSGESHFICSVCQFEKVEFEPALNHQYEITMSAATFTEDGINQVKCSRCGDITESTIIKRVAAPSLSKTKYTYNGKIQKPIVTVRDSSQAALKEGKDYILEWQTDCKKAGKHTIVVKLQGNYEGEKTLVYEISPIKISSAVLTYTTSVYSGYVKTPGVTVKAGKTTLARKATKSGTTVSITYSKGRKNVGTYKVTVKGTGNYTGTITKTFTINPKSTYLTSLKAGTKSVTAKWVKKTAQISGYQLRYSNYSSMKKSKTIKVPSYKTTTKKISKLTKKKKYYVQIRTYKIVSGKTYYSAWSKWRSVKAK